METKKLYLFNPFRISDASEQEIADTYSKLYEQIAEDAENGFEVSKNINLYADMNYLLGEMISRIKLEVSNMKNEMVIKENKEIYTQRNEWTKSNSGKAPAMCYFEALAKEKVQEDLKKLTELESKLFRFQKAYESIESKQNALKKKLEAIRYEI